MDLIFDENHKMSIQIEDQSEDVFLILSDDLDVIDEDLSISYKEKIIKFIKNSDKWFIPFKEYILEWGKKEYKTDNIKQNFSLINIFVLFEQEEDEKFGLEYGVPFDEEHNCGIKVKKTNKGDFEIYEIGTGDVAFC